MEGIVAWDQGLGIVRAVGEDAIADLQGISVVGAAVAIAPVREGATAYSRAVEPKASTVRCGPIRKRA